MVATCIACAVASTKWLFLILLPPCASHTRLACRVAAPCERCADACCRLLLCGGGAVVVRWWCGFFGPRQAAHAGRKGMGSIRLLLSFDRVARVAPGLERLRSRGLVTDRCVRALAVSSR